LPDLSIRRNRAKMILSREGRNEWRGSDMQKAPTNMPGPLSGSDDRICFRDPDQAEIDRPDFAGAGASSVPDAVSGASICSDAAGAGRSCWAIMMA